MLEAEVVTKWLEPYVVLETFKKHYVCQDITFDGTSKIEKESEFLNSIENFEGFAFGLYLKNVNKFYFMTSNMEQKTILEILTEDLGLKNDEIKTSVTVGNAVNLIDMAKAEVSIFIKK